MATIAVGARPQALAVDADHDRVYVANTSGGSVSVIDGSSNRVAKTESVGAVRADAYAMTANPANRKVYIASLGRTGFASLLDR